MTYSIAVTNRFRKDERKLDNKTSNRMYGVIAKWPKILILTRS